MKFRHEIKHYINTADYLLIKSKLRHIAKLDYHADAYGEYQIRSLYFDNYQNKILSEKISGVNHREKFRIRFYNGDSDFIKLEKKSKINGLCSKLSTSISKAECEKILAHDITFLKESSKPLFNELYAKMKDQVLRPKTIVDYTREAYIYAPGNVRITFDKKIRTGINSTDLFNPQLATIPSLDRQYIVLEVKFDQFFPDIIADVIQTHERRATSVSKYALCRLYG